MKSRRVWFNVRKLNSWLLCWQTRYCAQCPLLRKRHDVQKRCMCFISYHTDCVWEPLGIIWFCREWTDCNSQLAQLGVFLSFFMEGEGESSEVYCGIQPKWFSSFKTCVAFITENGLKWNTGREGKRGCNIHGIKLTGSQVFWIMNNWLSFFFLLGKATC